jgi:hypothetical protein
VANEEQRQGLLVMAETWDGLAANRAAQVERQKRIDALDQLGAGPFPTLIPFEKRSDPI